jgi:teichuronic acid biosynthesis glycosyltransferase TuaC
MAGSLRTSRRETAAEMSAIAGIHAKEKRRNLHVLTLTPFYPHERDEAAGCFVSEPLDGLAKLGIQNSVFAVQPFYRAKSRPSASGVTAVWLRYPALPGGLGLSSAGALLFARIVGRVRDIHSSSPIDLVHAHAPLPCGHAAMLLNRELGIPYAVSVHGLDVFSTVQVGGNAGEWCRRISKHVYTFSRRVICISERVRELVIEGVGRNCRTSVIYNGVNPELFYPSQNSSSGAQIILSVGTLIPIKGHDLLIRGLAALLPEFPSLILEIIGDGPEKFRLQTLAQQLQIAERVHFLGRQSRQQVAAAMQRCTLFALPSRYEGLGCVYLEAMSTGKAVIGCRGQGIAEIIKQGSNGFLVGPDNEKELTIALAMLLRDECLRGNIGSAARDTILDRLTLAHQAENLARIFRECAA